MDDVGGVRRLERAGDLRGHQQGPIDRQRTVADDELFQVGPLEVLHDEVERAVGRGAGVGHVDDVGVPDLRGGARLAAKAFDQIGAVVKAGVEHLDGDPPADVDVVGLVDPPHGPFAAQTADVVTPAQRAADARILARSGHVRVAPGRGAGQDRRRSADATRQQGAGGADQPLTFAALFARIVGEERPHEPGQPLGVGFGGGLRQEARQVGPEDLGVRVAILALGRQRLEHDAIQLGRHPAGDGRRRRDRRIAGPRQRVDVALAWLEALIDRKELPPGEQLPQQDARRVDVDPAVERPAPRLLGRQIAELAEDDPRRGALDLEDRHRQAEVGQLDLAAVREQHVGRRDVAVDQLEVLEGVRVGQRPRDLLDDVGRHIDREGDAALGAAVPGGQQILPLDVLHGQEDLAVLHAGVEDRDQVAVGQAQRDHHLVAEAPGVLGGHQVGQHLLDHARFLQAGRAGERQIELSHPPSRQRLEEHVGIESARETRVAHHGRGFYLAPRFPRDMPFRNLR